MTTAVGKACLLFVSIHVLMLLGILLLSGWDRAVCGHGMTKSPGSPTKAGSAVSRCPFLNCVGGGAPAQARPRCLLARPWNFRSPAGSSRGDGPALSRRRRGTRAPGLCPL